MAFAIVACAMITAPAQAKKEKSGGPTVVYDWSSNSKVPESYPRITRTQTVTFRITNVNDILFSYRLEVTQKPMEFDDFKQIAGLFQQLLTKTTKSENQQIGKCSGLALELKDALKVASKAIGDDTALPIGYLAASSHPSVALSQSLEAWKSHRGIIKDATDLGEQWSASCKGAQDDPELRQMYLDFKDSVSKIEDKVNGPHVIVDTHELSPGNDVSVSVVEMFRTETISTKTFSFPGSDVLTLSAGSLFSAIPDRTYEPRKTPASTLNVLTVEGNSRATPSLVALLNYSLGALRLDGDTTGLALSAGPVIKLGAKSDASSFGFFAGISAHLYHRFYITPGFHFGQFSDFPVGFGNGSSIPENFGELTPVKRWTTKFGLAITFKTKDFSGLTAGDKPAVTGDEAGNKAAPAATPSPSPAKKPDTVTTNLSLGVARDFLALPRRSVSPSAQPDQVITPEPMENNRNSDAKFLTSTPALMMASVSSRDVPTVESTAAGFHITSIDTRTTRTNEHILLNSAVWVRDYSMYFRGGRFYLLIPNAKLDLIQEDLEGRSFSQLLVEKRGGDLILSVKLLPGTKASVVETPQGLDVALLPPGAN
jgi:hypothetical protein